MPSLARCLHPQRTCPGLLTDAVPRPLACPRQEEQEGRTDRNHLSLTLLWTQLCRRMPAPAEGEAEKSSVAFVVSTRQG